MDNKEFKNIIKELLQALGFKNKGNYWKLENDVIEKLINLQKSNHSNLYYINYGYNLKNLYYDDVKMHISSRLSQSDAFDLENDLNSKVRIDKIKEIINNEILSEFNKIHNESDLLVLLKNRPHTNDIFIIVKEYLKLKD